MVKLVAAASKDLVWKLEYIHKVKEVSAGHAGMVQCQAGQTFSVG